MNKYSNFNIQTDKNTKYIQVKYCNNYEYNMYRIEYV